MIVGVQKAVRTIGRRWLSVLQYPFPKVTSKLASDPVPSSDSKEQLKWVKFVKAGELAIGEGVTQEKIDEFAKSHKTTIETAGKKVELVNIDRSGKVAVDSKSRTVLSVSQQASQQPSVVGAVSQYLSSAYEFHLKTTEKRKQQPEIILDGLANAEYIVELAHSRSYSRELANTRANVATTEFMENQARQIADECGLEITVLPEKELEREGFGLMHAVGRASVYKPRLVNLTYRGTAGDQPWVAFVGKGLCFDSGGLNIKINNSMMGMHLDKHGSVSVMAAMRSIARLKLPINITASMGFVENSINENAYRPGDILRSRKGLTVEIGNTDAEGRLVLADVMNWTQEKFKPRSLVELSTLTGAIVVALGHSAAGLFSNSDRLTSILKQAGKVSRDSVWHMPVLEEHRQYIKPKAADLSNASMKPAGGSAQAAAFLESFVEKGVEWAHVDIAGASMDPSSLSTGFGSRLLIEYARQESQKTAV